MNMSYHVRETGVERQPLQCPAQAALSANPTLSQAVRTVAVCYSHAVLHSLHRPSAITPIHKVLLQLPLQQHQQHSRQGDTPVELLG